MATNNSAEEKLEHLREEEEEEEEEALSLCDLPVNLTAHEDHSKSKPASQLIETQEEFDFPSWGGPCSKESEMCVADEVFFQGQILPLRLSLTTPSFQRDSQQFKRCESFYNGSVSASEFRSNSSRSSSLRSQNSSSSSCSTATTNPRISKLRIHTHPNPQPQLKVTVPRQSNFGGRKSSAWEFFRLGVAPAPEIGLQGLKVRRTSSNGSRNNNNNNIDANINAKSVKMSYNTNHRGKINHVFKQFVGKGSGLWSGCKCSVETVQSNIVMIKSDIKSANKAESTTHAMKEKVLELKRQKHRQKQEKGTMSRRRTFEWVKELSHASYSDEEALLSNP
ncbi:uncharacterized protein LOC113870250 [Abrus precatorius]|uniref:Uncharacterized protein LOC113870250 n=1 Tax=Abrus precatorius TaxID=3816 RepID=A0A8B8M676_ABRPR|nr:uncharacterized protein LOC113870250 [Abrus precatorius]